MFFTKLLVKRSIKSLLFVSTKRFHLGSTMANSRFDYVRSFETNDELLPNCWIVVRIDGRNFHKFTKTYNYTKPNDNRGLELMNMAATHVMKDSNDIVVCYGQSDEYSFVFHKSCTLYNRRSSKIQSYVNSLFTSAFCFFWSKFFGEVPLVYPPSFDARCVLYPTDQNLKDYLSWRQADVHINNLYNTCFWNLVQRGGMTNAEAEKRLSGTFSADKNELLFSEFGINYNNESAMFRKGTILLKKRVTVPDLSAKEQILVTPVHIDLIGDEFWLAHDELLTKESVKAFDVAAAYGPNVSTWPNVLVIQIEKLILKKEGMRKLENI